MSPAKCSFVLGMILTTSVAFGQTVLTTEFQDTQPKFILNSDGTSSGLCIELARLLESKGFQFTFPANYVPINRILEDLSDGNIDVYFGLAVSPEREKSFRFIRELFRTQYQLVTKKGSAASSFHTLNEVRSARDPIMVISGSASALYFQSLVGLVLEPAPTALEMAFNRLLSGDALLFGYYDLGDAWFLSRPEYQSLTALPISFTSAGQWLCVSKSVPEATVQALGKAFDEVKASPQWTALVNRYFGSLR